MPQHAAEWDADDVNKPNNLFLDLEAEEDEDDEGLSSEPEENQLEWEVPDEEEEEDVLSHRTLSDVIQETTGNLDWDTFIGDLETRLNNRGRRVLDVEGKGDDAVSPPGPSELLFEIPCTAGQEEANVFKLMRMSLDLPDPKAFASSIFARKTIPGRIFLEVPTPERAHTIAQLLPDLNHSKISVVPRDWMTKLLRPSSQPPIRPQTWVRIRQVPKAYQAYRADVALVVKVERSRMIQVCVVPRLGDVEPGFDRPKRRVLEEIDLEYMTRDDLTEDGYLLIEGPVDMVTYGPNIWPLPEEFRFFVGCSLVSSDLRAKTEAALLQNALKLWDRVKVTAGSLLGLSGIIEEISEHTAVVRIASWDIIETLLLSEIRANFKPGDLVRVTEGGWKDEVGWVVAVEDHRATVFSLGRYDEDSIAFTNLEFYDDVDSVRLRNISPPSKRPLRDAWELGAREMMRENPNAKFHGKRVVIVGNHRFKGCLGTIRDTTGTGEAVVEVHVFNQRPERIPLSLLRISRGNKLQMLVGHCSVEELELPAPSGSATPLGSSTPMHESGDTGALSPAWDPSSATPASIADADIDVPMWLANEKFTGLRVQLVERRGDPFRRLEFISILNGMVTVKDGRETRRLPVNCVIPVLVNRKEDPIVCFAEGEFFGKLFKVKTFGLRECVVRVYGTKAGKGEKLFTIPTSSLAVIYPPLAGVAVVHGRR